MPRKWRRQEYDDVDYDGYDDYDEYDEDPSASTSVGFVEKQLGVSNEESLQQSKLGQTVTTEEGKFWRCTICTYDNRPEVEICDICGVARHEHISDLHNSNETSEKQQGSIEESFQQPRPGQSVTTEEGKLWRCAICTYDNVPELEVCDICGVARHAYTSDLHNGNETSATHESCAVGASALARALFSPVPHTKLKQATPQLQSRRSEGVGSSRHLLGELFGHHPKSLSVPSSTSTDYGIVPFQFDIPSPDEKILASQRGTTNSAKVSSTSADSSKAVSTSGLRAQTGRNGPPSTNRKDKSTILTTEASKNRSQGHVNDLNTHVKNGRLEEESSRKDAQLAEAMRQTKLDGDNSEQQKGRETSEVPTMKRISLDTYVPESWILAGVKPDQKQLLNLIVVGHVDAGKSTLMGRILHLLGRVSQKEMHKHEKESKQKGKGSFAYAWVLDEGSEERDRGVTMTIAVAHFETSRLRVMLLDAPGHKDFVPNMISGASQADAAILVVDASIGAFEAGLEGEGQGRGQTREHAQLVRSLGVEQLVVAVNKMDAVGYSKTRFDYIKGTLQPFLKQCGFKDAFVRWVPVSAGDGENLTATPTEEAFNSWYAGPSLLELVNTLEPPVRQTAKPLRLMIAEVMRTRTLGSAALGGKLESGAIQIGSKVRVMPSGEIATVKGIEREGQPLPVAMAGDSVDVGLTGVEPGMLAPGGVLCHPDYPVPVATRLEVRVLTLAIMVPILRGAQVVLHAHHARQPARIAELIALLDSKTGAVLRQRPRCLTANQTAVIELVPEEGVCVEEYANFRALGRVALRDAGKTIAVGIVTGIVSAK